MVLPVMLVSLALAAQQGGSLDEALSLARTRDAALYDAFNAGYRLAASGIVDSVEVITEFRRAVLLARAHTDRGDFSFTAQNLATEMAPFRGTLSIVATVRLNPHNTYVQPPSYELYIRTGPSTKPLGARDFKRDPVYPPGSGGPGASLAGVRLEGTFSTADVASAPDPYVTIADDHGAVIWQGRLDLTRYR
jgi:hypothetical protein